MGDLKSCPFWRFSVFVEHARRHFPKTCGHSSMSLERGLYWRERIRESLGIYIERKIIFRKGIFSSEQTRVEEEVIYIEERRDVWQCYVSLLKSDLNMSSRYLASTHCNRSLSASVVLIFWNEIGLWIQNSGFLYSTLFFKFILANRILLFHKCFFLKQYFHHRYRKLKWRNSEFLSTLLKDRQ